MVATQSTTCISIIDRPCGYGKSTGLIAEVNRHRINNPDAQILIVLPLASEIDRFLSAVGSKDWFVTPTTTKDVTTKTTALIKLLNQGKNILTTHALYERINQFGHLLTDYHVVIDEVPTTAKEVSTGFGSGVFYNLLVDKQYLTIDPVTQLIQVTSRWLAVASSFSHGTDKDIVKFMNKVQYTDVYFVSDSYQVMPLPDVFFTAPKGLTLMTFTFEGSQLDHYMNMRGYKYHIQQDHNELIQFKKDMRALVSIHPKHTILRTGYSALTSREPAARKKVGNFIKNTLQQAKKGGTPISASDVLVSCPKDAWYGTELNPASIVKKGSRLKTLTKIGSATYVPLTCRGTNDFKHLNTLILLGKLNMNPGLVKFLGMSAVTAREHHTTSELIQLLYRTGIRDKKPVFIISADKENARLLKEFMKG